MDFNQVRYFLSLANTLNFTRAAEQCYVTQPALTQAIKRLETELGGQLISRSGRETELTELGKSLRGYFEQIDRTRQVVRKTAKAVVEGEVSELNIGIMCTIGPHIIASMLHSFHMEYPMISLVLHDVTHESIPELILSGSLDGAFYSSPEKLHPKLNTIDLYEEKMVVTFNSNDMNNGKAAFPEFHSVYIDPLSWETYKESGKFRDGTILIKELVSVGSKSAVSGKGYFMGKFVGLEATIKSAKHFPDEPGNWAYFSFSTKDHKRLNKTAKAFPTAACNACHSGSAADDFVFTQYYPVLEFAKGKGEDAVGGKQDLLAPSTK